MVLIIYAIIFDVGTLLLWERSNNPNYIMASMLFIVSLFIFFVGFSAKSIYLKLGFGIWGVAMISGAVGNIIEIGTSIWFVVLTSILLIIALMMFFKSLRNSEDRGLGR